MAVVVSCPPGGGAAGGGAPVVHTGTETAGAKTVKPVGIVSSNLTL